MTETASYLDKLSAHHERGVELARLGSERAMIPEVKSAADRMLKEEKENLAQIKKWRSDQFAFIPGKEMPDTISDLKDLKNSMKGEFDRVFLDKLIEHEQQEVSLSQIGIPAVENKAIIEFSQENIKESTKEVTDLQMIKGSLNSRKF